MTIVAAILLSAAQAGGLTWKPPASWPVQASSSTMRVATHRLAPAPGDSEPAELAIFFFGREGGAVGANVERWFAQFTPEPGSAVPSSRVETLNGIRLTRVSAEGTFASGMPGQSATSKKNYALLGAIAEGPEGNIFFKLTGPRKTVRAAGKHFDGMLRTLAHQSP
jgi:hypothetical protein